jgi:hypothetical protein
LEYVTPFSNIAFSINIAKFAVPTVPTEISARQAPATAVIADVREKQTVLPLTVQVIGPQLPPSDLTPCTEQA